MLRRISLMLLLAFALASPGCGKGATDRENRAVGDGVVSALERHRRDHGVYPAHLDNLVPAYLPHPSNISWASRAGEERYKRFNYEVLGEGADYRLAYPEAPIGPFRSDMWFETGSHRQDWRPIY